MKKISIIIMLIIIFCQGLSAAEDVLDLDKIADDRKFQNGVQFLSLENEERALNEFKEYLEIYINGTHRHEAYLQIAGIYFKSFEYQKAVRVYTSLYEEFSNSEFGVEAYYMTGICYRKMGFDLMAADIFKKIQENHPGSAFAYKSRVQMDILKILSES